jgi:predicted nucleic acid-binding protein
MPNSQRFYWDACVILSYVSGEAGRLPDIASMLHEADRGEIEIFTSELSVVEVAFASQEKLEQQLDLEMDAVLDGFWEHPSPIKRIDIHPLITREARTIIRAAMGQKGWSVKSADAIHLATAKRLQVEEFHTYEELPRRTRWSQLIGIPVAEPMAAQPELTPQTSTTVPEPPA